jgi:dihydrolipoamide dehydrogenase
LAKLRRLGVRVEGATFDYGAIKKHQEQIVRVSALGARKSLEDAGVELIEAQGRIAAPGEVVLTPREGERRTLPARDIVIAWGSEPSLPAGVQPSARVLTSDGLLALPTLPESILIVGGSVIGVEFATFLAELGVAVTLIEYLPRLLPGEEPEASALMTQALAARGVKIHTALGMAQIRETGAGVELTTQPAPADGAVATPGGVPAPVFSAACALVCTGRQPRLHREELDALGVAWDRRGIAVDGGLSTTVPGIHAVGDATGGIMLAHRAAHQGRFLAARLSGAGAADWRDESVPGVVYAHPPLARVGLTEAQARDRGLMIEVHRADYGANITARTKLYGAGFVKLLFAGERLAGATVAGELADELIAPLSLALAAGLGRKALAAWVIPHPSLAEVLAL